MFLVCIRHWILCFIKGELVNLYGFNLVPIESCEWLGGGGGFQFQTLLSLYYSSRGSRHKIGETGTIMQIQPPFAFWLPCFWCWTLISCKGGNTVRPLEHGGQLLNWSCLTISYYSSCHIILSETSKNSFLFIYFKTLWHNWFWFDLL